MNERNFNEVSVLVDGRAYRPLEATLICNRDDFPRLDISVSLDPTKRTSYLIKTDPPKTLSIMEVIFNPPATIVFWSDNTKTVVKCDYEYEEYDPEKGIAMAIAKKLSGDNKRDYYNVFRHWMKKWENKDK